MLTSSRMISTQGEGVERMTSSNDKYIRRRRKTYIQFQDDNNIRRRCRTYIQLQDDKCSKCSTTITSSQAVSVQAQPVRYPSPPGHNPPGTKCHTGTQAQLSTSYYSDSKCHTGTQAQLIYLAITWALNAPQGHKPNLSI